MFYFKSINEKVGEVGISQVFTKLMIFSKTASKKIAVMQLLDNCGEYPYKTPVKKLVSNKFEAVVL